MGEQKNGFTIVPELRYYFSFDKELDTNQVL